MNNTRHFTLTKAQFHALVSGRHIARFSTHAAACRQTEQQDCFTCIFLGDDERYWVPATPGTERLLLQAGYELA